MVGEHGFGLAGSQVPQTNGTVMTARQNLSDRGTERESVHDIVMHIIFLCIHYMYSISMHADEHIPSSHTYPHHMISQSIESTVF